MGTYLDRILDAHRARAADDRRDPAALVEAALACPPTRGFAAALAGPGVSVVAEVKRASPSKGPLAPDLDPGALAAEYQAAGAAAVSVLTDEAFFSGSVADLAAARAAVGIPVLRKDFTVGPADVCDARLMGADAVLLIAAALGPDDLVELNALAGRIGIDALVEVHDEEEAGWAVAAGASVVGVNQRDLRTFEVDTGRAKRVAAAVGERALRVAESGIRDATDVAELGAAGFDAVLVGERLVTARSPGDALRGLLSSPAPSPGARR